jgi:WD40 repeat protein
VQNAYFIGPTYGSHAIRGPCNVHVCVADDSTLASMVKVPNAHSGRAYSEYSCIRSVAFSPDGTRIVSGSDFSIKLWGVLPCAHTLQLLSVVWVDGAGDGARAVHLLLLRMCGRCFKSGVPGGDAQCAQPLS